MTLRSSIAFAAIVLATTLAGCANTVTGVATDVKQTGKAVERAVN